MALTELQIDHFVEQVGHARFGRPAELPEIDAAKAFGGRLFETVFGDEVKSCLRSSLDDAREKEIGLRIRLRLTDVPELADVPWEYLYDPQLNRFLGLSATTPIVRYLDLPEAIRPLSVKPPLQVLVMISSPSGYPALDIEGEWSKLNEALGKLKQNKLVELTRMDEATLSALQGRLRRGKYHVFHFIGHGEFDQKTNDGVLLLEGASERGRRARGLHLGTLLHDEPTLRLAVLNACEGARSSRTDPFAGVAQSLVQQGIPAVIGMQFPVTDQAAIAFAREFYAAIADGFPVDAALAEARKAMLNEGEEDAAEWGTPVLYMRAADGRIFDFEGQGRE